MDYPVEIEGFENQTTVVRPAGFWSGPKLLVDGQPAPKGSRRGRMALVRDDGREVEATWRPRALGFDMPELVVDGVAVQVIEPLPWYQLLWSGLPVALVFAGGAIGALCGILAFWASARVFRSKLNRPLRYLLSAAISLVALAVWMMVALLISGAR